MPTSATGYEPNDTCDQARPITTDGVPQAHTFLSHQDIDWAYFNANAHTDYLIEAQVPAHADADIALFLYDRCNGPAQENQNFSFSPDVRLRFTAPADGPIYLRLSNEEDNSPDNQPYFLSVRALNQPPQPGAVIIVAGRYRNNDPLQENIYHTTDAVFRLFQDKGYPADRIYYIAPDTSRPNVDAPATTADLQAAITIWAQDKVGPDRALTLYMMDHGGRGRFYLDRTRGQIITPEQLDAWLDVLEAAHPGLKVNLIYEACYSGSFIQDPGGLSKPGRVIITSTSARALAYASRRGAFFSDYLLDHLRQNRSLYNSFQEARWATQAAYFFQQPWLDDNGNGVANDAGDGREAAQRGFAFSGTFVEEAWPPYVAEVQGPTAIVNGMGTISARVLVDASHGDRVQAVWAVVYPPSYQTPDSGEEMVALPTPVPLVSVGNDQFAIDYPGFTERGTYTIIVYAESEQGLRARPVTITVQNGFQIFLPMLMR